MDEVALQAMLRQHPSRVAGKFGQAVTARTGDWSTGSSMSSGEEDRKSEKSGGKSWALWETEWRRSPGRARPSTQERKWHGGRVGNGR